MEAVKQRHKTKKAKVKPVVKEVEPEPEPETIEEKEDENIKETASQTETTSEQNTKEEEEEKTSTQEQSGEIKAEDTTSSFDLLKDLQEKYGNKNAQGNSTLEGMADENTGEREKYTDNFTVSAYANLAQQQPSAQEQKQKQSVLPQKQKNGKELTVVQKELLYVSQLIRDNEKMESIKDKEQWNDVPGDLESSQFYKLVKGYREVQLVYRSRCITFDDLRQKLQTIVKNTLWDFTSNIKTDNRRCTCGTTILTSTEEFLATINNEAYATLCEVGAMSTNRLSEAFLYLNEVYFAYLKIHRYINNFFLESENFSQVSPNDPVIAVMYSQQTPKLAEEITQLRHMLNVLFFFERNRQLGLDIESKKFKDQPLVTFHKDVEKWILSLGSALLRRASYDDHMFLLQHLLCCPNASQWNGASLIQFPPVWNDMTASHFANVAIALVSPVFKGNQCSQIIKEVLDWIDYEDAEQESMRHFQISEGDLMNIFEQLPIGPFCNFLLDRQQTEYASDIVTNLLKALCTSLFNLRVYKGFTKLVIRIIIVLLSVVAKADRSSGRTTSFNITQEQLDAFIMTTAYFIMSLKEASLWQFVSELPLDSLSKEGMWQFVGMIHSLPILRLPQTYDEWETVDWNFISDDEEGNSTPSIIDIDEDSLPMENLAILCANNPCEGIFVFDTLACLAQVGDNNVAFTCISTLFHIGFIDKRSSKLLVEEAVLKLSYLCEVKGENIGYMLRLIFNYIDYADKEKSIQTFFKKLPLDTWVPDYDTLDFIARVLIKNPQNEYAHMILKRVRWAASEISLSTNRFAALQMLELIDWYQKKKNSSSFFDFSTSETMSGGITRCKAQFKRFRYFKLGAAEEFPEKYKSVGAEVLDDAIKHVGSLKHKKGWNKMTETYLITYFLLSEHENAVSEWCPPEQPALTKYFEPLEKSTAVFILSQLVPMLILKDGEHFMSAITPKFVSIVFKKIFAIEDTVKTLFLLIGEPMKVLKSKKDKATMLADFWIRCATLSDKWTTNTESLAIIETTLNAYFCFISKDIPAQFYGQHVVRLLTQREAAQRITLFSILPLANIKISATVKYPLFVMSTLFTEFAYLMQNNKFRSFNDYFTKVEQILDYGLLIPEDFEFNLIFWQLGLNLFFSSIIGQQNQHTVSILQNRSGSMIMRFMRIGESYGKKDSSDTVEGMKSKFFFGAAALLQGSQNRPRSFQEVVYGAGHNNQYLIENEILLGNADPARQIHEVMGTLLVEMVDLSKISMYDIIMAITELRVPASPKYLQYTDGVSKYDAVIKKFAVNISAILPLPQIIQPVKQIRLRDEIVLKQVDLITKNIREYSILQLNKYNSERGYINNYLNITRNMYIREGSVKEEAKTCTSCGKMHYVRIHVQNSVLSEEVKNIMNQNMKSLDEMVLKVDREIGFYMDIFALSNLLGEIKRVLNDIIDSGSKEKEKENEILIKEVCEPIFCLIFETWEDFSVNWFIGSKFHSSMVSTTNALIKFHSEACRLLDFFLKKPIRIIFAVQVFQPCKTKETFCELLGILLGSRSVSVAETDDLLKKFLTCFDAAIWLSLEPTFEEKCAVLDVICKAFNLNYMVPSVRNYLIETFRLLVQYDIKYMAGYSLNNLFVTGTIREINNLWSGIDKNLIIQNLAFEDIIGILEIVNIRTEEMRAKGQDIFGPLCQWFDDFIPFLVSTALEKMPLGENAIVPIAKNTFRLYKVLFGSNVIEGNNAKELRKLSENLVSIINLIHRSGRHPNVIWDLWYFLTKDLQILGPNTKASLLLQDIVFMPLCGAPWEKWLPTLQDFELIKNIFESRRGSTISVGLIELILNIYVSVPIGFITFFNTKEFHEIILYICISALLSGPTKYDDKPEVLLGKINQMKWELISPEAFSEIFIYVSSTLSSMQADTTVITKKTLLIFYILRMVCGLKLEREVLPEEITKPYRDPTKIAIFADNFSRFPRIDIFASTNMTLNAFSDIVTSILNTTDIIIRTSNDGKSFEESGRALISLLSLYNINHVEKVLHNHVLGFISQWPLSVPNFISYACNS